MKVLLLSGASSIHTIRWANGLSSKGIDVYLATQQDPLEKLNNSVKVSILPFKGNAGYYLNTRKAKNIIRKIEPDIVNAHYATGYGTTARLVNFHPYILSVWGSDVYDFPVKSFLHKRLVQKNLVSADTIASTSKCMATQTSRLMPGYKNNIEITPFGVNIDLFDNYCNSLSERDRQKIVIGTVKVLADKYGIDLLIKSFHLTLEALKRKKNEFAENIYLKIVGEGPERNNLEKLVTDLNIADKVEFMGRVNSEDVPKHLDTLDIYVALSRLDSESFGVAVIEAGAAKRPVIVSNVGGLPEVVIDNKTGIVIEKESPEAASKALQKLIFNRDLRIEFGQSGYEHVINNYNWDNCIDNMIKLYKSHF